VPSLRSMRKTSAERKNLFALSGKQEKVRRRLRVFFKNNVHELFEANTSQDLGMVSHGLEVSAHS